MSKTALRAGELNRRVVLERYVEHQDGTGFPLRAYEPLEDGDAWASFEPQGGRELLESQQSPQDELRAVFRMRHRFGVDATMQIVMDGVPWGIESVAEIGYREGLEIVAVRRPSPVGNEAA